MCEEKGQQAAFNRSVGKPSVGLLVVGWEGGLVQMPGDAGGTRVQGKARPIPDLLPHVADWDNRGVHRGRSL